MKVDDVLAAWKKGNYKPLYWFQGEEDFEIDQLVQYAENNILSESERAFNLSIFYGRDSDVQHILQTCKMHPMVGERTLVIIKEAQMLKEIDQLDSYFNHPLSSTILIVAYKGGVLDKRKNFTKTVNKTAVVFETAKVRDDQELAPWVIDYAQSKGVTISPKCAMLIIEHIGNNRARISNEIDKLLLNLGSRTTITEHDIEVYIGISKEYNVFELKKAVAQKNLSRALAIIQYFDANPKSGSIHSVVPILFMEFQKLYMAHSKKDLSFDSLKPIYFNYYFYQEALPTLKLYSLPDVEKALLLLYQYNLKSIGVGVAAQSSTALLKELITKIIL